jgi:hypothetical protein
MGIGPEHVPALIEIALTWPEEFAKPDSVEVWAPPHAWRALAQLGAVEAVEPLLRMMNRLAAIHDDWYLNEFPRVFGVIGPAAIPALAAYLADTSNRNFARSAAASGLKRIAQKHPETLPQVIAHLNGQLARFEDNDEEFNALVLCDLLDLKAVESAELIGRAYAAGKVDEGMLAWEDVQRELGISAARPVCDRMLPAEPAAELEEQQSLPATYPPPLDRLFEMGKIDLDVEWQGSDPDYVGELGLSREHLPALIEIARRWEDADAYPEGDKGWAPVHAWRAMGQLRAAEAVGPLLRLLTALSPGGDDYHIHDFPVVFGMIGPAAVPALAAYLHDAGKPLYARITVGDSLCNIGLRHPEARGEALGPLAEQLARFQENDYELNSFLVAQLTRLKAVEAAETIERAYASNCVEEDICGYWGTVRQELGVAGLGLAPDEPPRPPRLPNSPLFRPDTPAPGTPEHTRLRQRQKQEKAKRKQQEKAKKRNRKRR